MISSFAFASWKLVFNSLQTLGVIVEQCIETVIEDFFVDFIELLANLLKQNEDFLAIDSVSFLVICSHYESLRCRRMIDKLKLIPIRRLDIEECSFQALLNLFIDKNNVYKKKLNTPSSSRSSRPGRF